MDGHWWWIWQANWQCEEGLGCPVARSRGTELRTSVIVFVRGWVSFPSPPRLTIDRKQATSDTHSEQGRSCRTWSGCDVPKRGLDAQPFAWLTLTP